MKDKIVISVLAIFCALFAFSAVIQTIRLSNLNKELVQIQTDLLFHGKAILKTERSYMTGS